jgi:hypothetical protein
MASFKMEDLLNGYENDGTIVKSSHSKIDRGGERTVGRLQYRGYRSRKDTEELINKVLREAKRPLKFAEVAEAVDRRPTPFLRSILVAMAGRGELIETADLAPNERLPRFWYSLR